MKNKRKIKLALIGIGTGNPDHMTIEAIKTLQKSDVILLPIKGHEKQELHQIRTKILDEHLGDQAKRSEFKMPSRNPDISDYLARVEDWHDQIAQLWQGEIERFPKAETLSLLIWGDPSLYDSSLRISARLEDNYDLTIQMIAGITAIQGLTAAHNIPLNSLGGSVHISTGRNLRDHGWPPIVDRMVIMLDGENSFTTLSEKHMIHINWSAYVGMEMATHISGWLCDVENDIIEERERLRTKHGWVMDIYMLHKHQRSC